MSRPLLSVICPTIGRPTLACTLASIRDQTPASKVEIIVVGDMFGGDFRDALAAVPAVCAEYQAKYVGHDAGIHAWGHPQRAYGAKQACGEWLMWSQDDNIYTPGAFDAILAALAGPQCPRLFRVDTRFGFTVWDCKGLLTVGHVDADCLCAPNLPAYLGTWTNRYEGDADMIAETVALWGDARWEDTLIVRSRPGG